MAVQQLTWHFHIRYFLGSPLFGEPSERLLGHSLGCLQWPSEPHLSVVIEYLLTSGWLSGVPQSGPTSISQPQGVTNHMDYRPESTGCCLLGGHEIGASHQPFSTR